MKNKWFFSTCYLLGMAAAYAQQTSYEQLMFEPALRKTAASAEHNFTFDSSALLKNQLPANDSFSGQQFQFNPRLAGGVFVYHTDSPLQALALPPSVMNAAPQNGNLYVHLLTKLMHHLFFDVAGGYVQDNTNVAHFYYNNAYNKGYSKNWFASAAALFTHTWKEFVFNANLSALRGDAQQDPYNAYFAYNNPWQTANGLSNKMSFIQENAEIQYRGNSFVQPFIGGGLLQVIDANTPLMMTSTFSPMPEWNQDLTGYKVGGGLAFNYKQYVFRLEQQYYQRGNLYHGNQSTLSVKMNLG